MACVAAAHPVQVGIFRERLIDGGYDSPGRDEGESEILSL